MRLSDSLHGAADDAPLEGVHVSAVEAARKVQRRRTARTSGFGALAMGGVALLAVGAVQLVPNLGGASSGAADSAADASFGEESLAGADAGGTMLAAGFCGGTTEGLAYGIPTVTLSGALASGEEAEPGSTLAFEATTTALEPVSLQTGRPLTYAYVLWDGMIVATYPGPDDAFTMDLVNIDLAEGETATDSAEMPLVNCWDGEPLPAGKYEVVLAQEYWSTAPEVEPTLPPLETDENDATGAPTATPVDPDDSGMTDDSASVGIAADQGFRVTSNAGALVITGDAVDEPFAAYLGGSDPAPVETPDDLLTPDAARSLYQDGLAGAWDMAAGTQRVVLTSYSADNDGTLWERSWYGCSYDGDEARTFPDESSQMDLLGVDVTLPSSITLRYGWVVDGNPELTSIVTNTSGWTLPYWGDAQPNMLLVRDGRVVAEAYPANVDQYGDVVMMDGTAASSMLVEPERSSTGYLAPDARVSGTFLWRDLNTCDYSSDLPAGTYTVLNQQSVYVDDGTVYYGYDDSAAVGPWSELEVGEAVADSSASVVTVPDGGSEWVELTVWTSLGEVTVTPR